MAELENVENTGRINSIDVLRGIALLGLPTMNIIHFSMPQAAYMNPYVYKADAFLNHTLFSFFNLFADQKFMSLFTLLFGASLLLLRNKNESRGADSSLIHYSRMFFLLLIGIIHFWFIWSGDILMFYAVIGMMLFPLAKLPPKILLWISAAFLGLSLYCIHIPNVTLDVLGKKEFNNMKELYAPNEDFIAAHEKLMLGTYTQTMSIHRDDKEDENSDIEQSEEQKSQSFKAMLIFVSIVLFILFKMMSMATLGMAFFKMGIVQGHKPLAFYKTLALFGVVTGGLITLAGLVFNYQLEWNIQSYFSYGWLMKEFGSVIMTLGYVGLFLYLLSKGLFSLIAKFAAKVGQMALTNYICQSVIFALLFYGVGLGLYGSVSRLQLIPIILGVWAVQIAFSYLWLKYFLQGPLEWLWRSMSTLKLQTLRKD